MTAQSRSPGEIGTATMMLVRDHLGAIGYTPPDEVFFSRIEKFAATLALWGSKLNLTASPDDPAEIAFHVLDSLAPLAPCGSASVALASAFAAGNNIIDLGSGAGFPGLILAAASSARFTLAEARRKRASFLSVTAAAMGIHNVRLDSSRAGELPGEPLYEVATGRAFAQPAKFFSAAGRVLKPGAIAILYASPAQRPELEGYAGGAFAAPEFIGYQVPRGTTPVDHMLVVMRRLD